MSSEDERDTDGHAPLDGARDEAASAGPDSTELTAAGGRPLERRVDAQAVGSAADVARGGPKPAPAVSRQAEAQAPGRARPQPGRAAPTIDAEPVRIRDAGPSPSPSAAPRVAAASVKVSRSVPLSQGLIAAGVALALGAGFVVSAEILTGKHTASVAQAAPPPPDPTVLALRHVEDEVRLLKASLDAVRSNTENSRQDEAIRGLKRSVDALKQDLEASKTANSYAVAQLAAKLDKSDRDPSPKLAEISARLDKLDKSDRDPSPKLAEITARLDKMDRDPTSKLAEITARLDRIEKQVSSAAPTGSVSTVARSAPAPLPPTPPMPPVAPAQAAAADKTAPKPATVEGWLLRDVYGGVALLQGRGGGLREVAPGEFVPGVGEIRSIERRGRAWVVVTSRGIIEADNRW